MASRFLNDIDIAKAQRDFEIKKAAYDVEVQTKKAEAEMAYELQAAKTKQRIKEEQMQIKVSMLGGFLRFEWKPLTEIYMASDTDWTIFGLESVFG